MSYPIDESAFAALVRRELIKARAKHRGINSPHEGLAVILEEFEELKAEVFRQSPDPFSILHELIQTAAMCERMASDLLLTEIVSADGYTQADAIIKYKANPERLLDPDVVKWFDYSGPPRQRVEELRAMIAQRQ